MGIRRAAAASRRLCFEVLKRPRGRCLRATVRNNLDADRQLFPSASAAAHDYDRPTRAVERAGAREPAALCAGSTAPAPLRTPDRSVAQRPRTGGQEDVVRFHPTRSMRDLAKSWSSQAWTISAEVSGLPSRRPPRLRRGEIFFVPHLSASRCRTRRRRRGSSCCGPGEVISVSFGKSSCTLVVGFLEPLAAGGPFSSCPVGPLRFVPLVGCRPGDACSFSQVRPSPDRPTARVRRKHRGNRARR